MIICARILTQIISHTDEMKGILPILLIVLLICSFALGAFTLEYTAPNGKISVAIVGSGISGSATALYLRDLFGKKIGIKIFEKENRVGGRLGVHVLNRGKKDEFKVEYGGSALVLANYHAQLLINRFGLTFVPDPTLADETLFRAIM
jgi:hypothetical protein